MKKKSSVIATKKLLQHYESNTKALHSPEEIVNWNFGNRPTPEKPNPLTPQFVTDEKTAYLYGIWQMGQALQGFISHRDQMLETLKEQNPEMTKKRREEICMAEFFQKTVELVNEANSLNEFWTVKKKSNYLRFLDMAEFMKEIWDTPTPKKGPEVL
jgi:hypothetical protein